MNSKSERGKGDRWEHRVLLERTQVGQCDREGRMGVQAAEEEVPAQGPGWQGRRGLGRHLASYHGCLDS